MAEWGKGLFSCFDDIGLCLLSFFLPCITFGKTMEAMGKSSCILGAVYFWIPLLNLICWIQLRGAIRDKYNIDGGIVGDLFAICCCPPCALVQENQQVGATGGDIIRS